MSHAIRGKPTVVVSVSLLVFCITGFAHAADVEKTSHSGSTGQWSISYANLEPDYYPDGQAGRADIGAYIRIVVLNKGLESDTVTDVTLNGVSLQQAVHGRPHPEHGKKNPPHKQYSIEFMEGGPPQALLDAGRPLWYRILPSDPAGGRGWTEVLVRLRHWTGQSIQVRLDTAQGHQMALAVQAVPDVKPMAPQQHPYIGLATMNVARDRLYVYVLAPQASKDKPISVKSIKVDGKEVTAAAKRLDGYNELGVIPLVVPLERAWAEGSFHLLDCRLSNGVRRVCSVRAVNGFFVMIYGGYFGGTGREFTEAAFNDFYEHYVETWQAPGGPEAWRDLTQDWWQAMARQRGVRITPNFHGAAMTYDHVRELAKAELYTQSYYLFDEPDVNDWNAGESHGVPEPLRLGLHAQWLVQLSEALRAADPVHPASLLVDTTFSPQNYYVYGQLADLMMADIYYPLGAEKTNWDPLPFIYNGTQVARAAFMPKPTNIVLSASPEPELVIPSRDFFRAGARAAKPGEERIAVYASVAGGANGISYYWYNAYEGHGCQWITDTWAEIGKLNRELQLLSPWIGVAFPVDLPAKTPEKVWAKAVAAGPDALLAIVINQDYRSSPEGFVYKAMNKAGIELQLPQGFIVNRAVSVEDDGPKDLPFSVKEGKAVFDLANLEVGRMVMLSSDKGVLKQLQGKWHQLQQR